MHFQVRLTRHAACVFILLRPFGRMYANCTTMPTYMAMSLLHSHHDAHCRADLSTEWSTDWGSQHWHETTWNKVYIIKQVYDMGFHVVHADSGLCVLRCCHSMAACSLTVPPV